MCFSWASITIYTNHPWENMKASVEWVNGLTYLAWGDSRHYTIVDYSDDKDKQKGSSPTELMLQSMLACTAPDIVSILKKMKEPIQGLVVNAVGTRATEHPKVFTDIEIEYIVRGNVKQESLDKAIALSQEKYCHISITFKRAGVNIKVSSKIIKE